MSSNSVEPGQSKRRAISKRTRFEVFKRDDFTCQYCGQRPPDVVLHTDHIEPHSKGGSDDIDNLITACHECNLGKSDKDLGDKAVRPDAMLISAEVAQELAELRTARAITEAYSAEIDSAASGYSDGWPERACVNYNPPASTFANMIRKYGLTTFDRAYMVTAEKVASRRISSYDYAQYMYGVMRNMDGGDSDAPA